MAAHNPTLDMVDSRPTIAGDCDLVNAGEIEAWLANFGDRPLEVDLSGVTFLGASALRALLNVRRHNANLRLINLSRAAQRTIEISGHREYLLGTAE